MHRSQLRTGLESPGGRNIVIPEIRVDDTSNDGNGTGVFHLSKEQQQQLPIGARISPENTDLNVPENKNVYGTVGPFLRVKETGQVFFITVRHIFGSQEKTDDYFIGRKVLMCFDSIETDNLEKFGCICGEVVAAEFSEKIDAALVELSGEIYPDIRTFGNATEEQLDKAGILLPLYADSRELPDIRSWTTHFKTEKDTESLRVVKLGGATGLTTGILQLENGNVKTSNLYIKEEEHKPQWVFRVMTYKDHLLVDPLPDEVFATVEDVGSAVFLIDKLNTLHCIGMLTRIHEDGKRVLVTPLWTLLRLLGQQLNKTLELALEENIYDTLGNTVFNVHEKEMLDKALEGNEIDKHIRINIVGFFAQGKTTLTRRLLGESLRRIDSTDGIDVHIRKCKITKTKWETFETGLSQAECLRRLVQVAKAIERRKSCSHTPDTPALNEMKSEATTIIYDRERKETAIKSEIHEIHEHPPGQPRDFRKRHGSDPIQQQRQRQKLLRQFSESLKRDTEPFRGELHANIWDFGGQFIYYATHQIFHSREAIYLLVFDLSKDLESVIIDYDFPDRKEKMRNSLKFWVNSIVASVGTEECTKPVIILVGTHKDKFADTAAIDEQFRKVSAIFAESKLANYIYDRPFAISSLDLTDKSFGDLKEAVFEIAKKSYRIPEVPAKWIPLEMNLLAQRHKNILTFEEVVDLDAGSERPLRNKENIKVFLKYHHDKGTLVYFDEEELDKYVIVSPQFLIDSFKSIISSKSLCTMHTHLGPYWEKLSQLAILETKLLDEVWSENSNSEFHRHRDVLLMFLKRHRILSELLGMDEKTGEMKSLGTYIIPSLLKRQCDDKIIVQFLKGKRYTQVQLGLKLKNSVVLSSLYDRITAAALAKWAPIEFQKQKLQYQNVGVYQLDLQHAGKIEVKENKGIELMVVNRCPPSEARPVVCDRFRRYVEMVVACEFQKLCREQRDPPYKYYLRCNHIEHDGIGSAGVHQLEKVKTETDVCCPDNCSHSIHVSAAKMEWFQNEKLEETGLISNKNLTDEDLMKVIEAIGKNWHFLGITLGFTMEKIERIRMDTERFGVAWTIFTMLKMWTQSQPENANLQFLINKMKSTDLLSINWDKIRNLIDNF